MLKYSITLLVCMLLVTTAGAQQYYKAELFFGRDRKGRNVSEREWQRFVDSCITPRFPDGMTIIDAKGQWRDDGVRKIIKEKTKVVVILCEKNATTDSALAYIKRQYCKLFQQKSVMEVDSKVERVTFDH